MKVEKVLSNQEDNKRRISRAESGTESSGSDFRAFLDRSLKDRAAGKVDEEALFSSMVHERVNRSGNVDAIKKFEARIEKHRRLLTRQEGFASEEKAAKFALRDVLRNKLMTKDEAQKIYSMAFSAAQLDSDASSLSDGIGGDTPAGAARNYQAALKSAESRMTAFDNGTETAPLRRLGEGSTRSTMGTGDPSGGMTGEGDSTTPSGTAVDGASGFLFKPVSDTQGKLVILAPENLTHNIESVVLRGKNGQVIESGQWGGIGNGDREHFRFNRPGGDYGKDLTVEIRLKGGGVKAYGIPDGSLRYD